MKKQLNRWVYSYPILKKLIMEIKIAIPLLLFSATTLMADPSYSQTTKINLAMENKKLELVMDEIERQSEFYFIFNQKQIDVERVISVRANNELITSILPQLFSGTNVNFAVVDRKIFLTTEPIHSQVLTALADEELLPKRITGTVTDNSGSPLPGVNVRVTGSNVGTTTGAAGTYSLEVPENAQSLTFSFVGMESKIVIIGTLTQIDVTMEESAIGLEEVVVTAYSTTKRSAITGSIGVVNMAALEKHRSTDIAATLQGLVPGVQVVLTSGQPGANQDILIRGLGSMTASSAPLYVVDGVPYDLSLNSISSSDIQSISIGVFVTYK